MERFLASPSASMTIKRSIEGYTYQSERGFDVAERVAGNQAVGQFTNMGIGMGMISGIGGSVGDKVGGMLQNTLNQENISQGQGADAAKCVKCGTVLPANAKFCLECGEKVAMPTTESEMICPKCNTKVPKGKFCLSCGASLASPVCSKCGKEVPAGAKFCLECGEKLS